MHTENVKYYSNIIDFTGDASLYAHYVFNAMFSEALKKNNGQITFSDYACALSLLCRGTIIDKIQWIFTLYDINKDGLYDILHNYITASDIYSITVSMCDLFCVCII